MFKSNIFKRFCQVSVLFLVLSLSCASAFADHGRHSWRRSIPSRHQVVVVRGSRYHYYAGRFYRPWFFGFGFTITVPPVGAVVRVLPSGSRVTIVAGDAYYYYEDVYYRHCPSGYVVVAPPARRH